MKLNKKLSVLGIGLGLIPNIAKADLYQCLACPAGTYGNGASTSCTPCPAGTYSGTGASSCTPCPTGQVASAGATSCTSCPDGTYASTDKCVTCEENYYCQGGVKKACDSYTFSPPGSNTCCSRYDGFIDSKNQCRSFSELNSGNLSWIVSGFAGSESCPTGTLQPGWYLVRLKGGTGSASGATLEYGFYLPSTSSYQLCAGGDSSGSGGGGGGSWLKLNWGGKDYYFVAGGGGGSGGNAMVTPFYTGGGGGGGIGGGGGSFFYGSISGGRSGPYAGGSVSKRGEGLNNGNIGGGNGWGSGGGAGGGGGGSGGNGAMDHGGTCDPITINIIQGYKITETRTGNFGGSGEGYKSSLIGAKSSHSSNVPNISSCPSSCAVLYKLNI